MKKKKGNINKKKINKKMDWQSCFTAISFGILISCFIFFGMRFYQAYSKYHVDSDDSNNSLAFELLNKKLKKVNDDYYFYNDSKDNYLEYSNIMWRIIKVNNNNQVVLVTDDIITTLAYGEDIDSFADSNISKWLNNTDNNKAVLESNLNTKVTLSKTSICIDKVDKATKCKKELTDYKIGIPSLEDYINTGSNESFMSNGQYFYLSNMDKEGNNWYVAGDKLDTTDGSEILGIKATITLPMNTSKVSGEGTKDKPYKIESETTLFGAYVKLGDNTWRVYNVSDTTLDLVLMDKVDATDLYYSNDNKYNTYTRGTYAYYLNHDYLRNLSYNDKINSKEFNNGYYGISSDYNFNTNQKTATANIGLHNIGDILLNLDIDSFSTMTNEQEDGELVYIINNNGTVYLDSNDSSNNIIATININKDLLKKGNGTKESPYEME